MVGALQYRLGDYDHALNSASHAYELHKDEGPTAHAIRALVFFKRHDLTQARLELSLAHKDAERLGHTADWTLLQEAAKLLK